MPQFIRDSLRARILTGIGIMLLPLLGLAAGALLGINGVNAKFKYVVEVVIEKMHPVMHLQSAILQAGMPANDYLIHGDRSERDEFARLSDEVERAFKRVEAASFPLAEERALVGSAHEAWRQVQSISETLLVLPQPVGDAAAASEMKRMDAHVDRAVDLLGRVHEFADAEIEREFAKATATGNMVLQIVSGVFGLGFIIAVWVGAALAWSILARVKALSNGARAFGKGNFSYRVQPEGHDELGQLAQTFNAMAEALEKSRAALAELATRDDLTGLYNQRAFYALLADELVRAQRMNRPASLLILDVDRFKRVNDTHGHLAGDAILKRLSELLGRQARAIDRVCRYGGEEITVILPETDLDAAANAAERLRAAVEAQPFDVDAGAPLRITVSVGVASFPAHADSAQALVAAADTALYAAKRGGRNRIIRYEPALGQPAARG